MNLSIPWEFTNLDFQISSICYLSKYPSSLALTCVGVGSYHPIWFQGGRDFFSQELFCLKNLPLHIFILRQSQHKISQRERHNSENHWKWKSRVLENCDPQSWHLQLCQAAMVAVWSMPRTVASDRPVSLTASLWIDSVSGVLLSISCILGTQWCRDRCSLPSFLMGVGSGSSCILRAVVGVAGTEARNLSIEPKGNAIPEANSEGWRSVIWDSPYRRRGDLEAILCSYSKY